jgi:putative endonuclease
VLSREEDSMSESTAGHLSVGRRGENLAARYLESRGLVVLSRNWRCRDGELDLVLTDGRTLIVCEVKTRTSTEFGTPAEAVSHEKAQRVRRLAHRWLNTYRVGWRELRFDIVSVLWPPGRTPRIDHLVGVF